MSVKLRNAAGRFSTYTTHRTVTYRHISISSPGVLKVGDHISLKMLESPNANLGGHYLVTLGQNTIEVASTKQDAYRMLDAAENVLKALGWVLVKEVDA